MYCMNSQKFHKVLQNIPGEATGVHSGRDVLTQIRRKWVFLPLQENGMNG